MGWALHRTAGKAVSGRAVSPDTGQHTSSACTRRGSRAQAFVNRLTAAVLIPDVVFRSSCRSCACCVAVVRAVRSGFPSCACTVDHRARLRPRQDHRGGCAGPSPDSRWADRAGLQDGPGFSGSGLAHAGQRPYRPQSGPVDDRRARHPPAPVRGCAGCRPDHRRRGDGPVRRRALRGRAGPRLRPAGTGRHRCLVDDRHLRCAGTWPAHLDARPALGRCHRQSGGQPAPCAPDCQCQPASGYGSVCRLRSGPRLLSGAHPPRCRLWPAGPSSGPDCRQRAARCPGPSRCSGGCPGRHRARTTEPRQPSGVAYTVYRAPGRIRPARQSRPAAGGPDHRRGARQCLCLHLSGQPRHAYGAGRHTVLLLAAGR